MRTKRKNPSRRRRPQKRLLQEPAPRVLSAQSGLSLQSRSSLWHRGGFATSRILSYPYFVVASYKRYPQHRESILLSHIILGVLLSSTVANTSGIIQYCFSALKEIVWRAFFVPRLNVGQWPTNLFLDA
jgi:hypothetical protein